MKFLLPLLGLLLLSGARAQKDVDIEGLRDVIQKLLTNGETVTSESLSTVSTSFSGVEKDALNKFVTLLNDAKEPEEIFLQDEIMDLETFRDLLYNLKSLGATVRPNVAEAVLSVIDDPSARVLAPTVAEWKRAGSVTLTDELKKSIDSTIEAIKQVIQGTDGTIRQRLKQKFEGMLPGITRSILYGIDQDLDKILKQQGGSFSYSADEHNLLTAAEVKASLDQVNKVLNREIVQYVNGCMKTMTRAQVKLQVEILLRKVYDNTELPAVLQAVLQAL